MGSAWAQGGKKCLLALLVHQAFCAARSKALLPAEFGWLSGLEPAEEMTAHTSTSDNNSEIKHPQSQDFGATIRKSVESPFAALIATMEEIGRETSDNSQHAERVDNAVELLESVRHGVQALVDLVAPTSAAPLNCTLDELGRSAVRSTPTPSLTGLEIAIDANQAVVNVDGPRFTRCLSYLLFANLSPGQQALFHVHVVGNNAAFTLNSPPAKEQVTPGMAPMPDGFMQLVAERELIRMGGSIECKTLPSGTTQITALLPLATVTNSSCQTGDAS